MVCASSPRLNYTKPLAGFPVPQTRRWVHLDLFTRFLTPYPPKLTVTNQICVGLCFSSLVKGALQRGTKGSQIPNFTVPFRIRG